VQVLRRSFEFALYSVYEGFSASIAPHKYLAARERLAFVYAASKEDLPASTFCLTLAFTGARISEVLSLTTNRIDVADEAIIFETLKQRKKNIFFERFRFRAGLYSY
jgi:hypothetical protein